METMKNDHVYRGNNLRWPEQRELFLGERYISNESMIIRQTSSFDDRSQWHTPTFPKIADLVCASMTTLKDDSIDSFAYLGRC